MYIILAFLQMRVWESWNLTQNKAEVAYYVMLFQPGQIVQDY